jgi:two-component system cell cycle response regulator
MPYCGSDDVAWLEEPTHPVSSEIAARPQTSDDDLAGVMLRKQFGELAYRYLAQARQMREGPLSCAVIEIDEFSLISRFFGQRGTEHLLKQVGGICGSFHHRAAYVAHTGDHKIAVLFPRTSLMNAFTLADNMRETIAAATFEVAGTLTRLSVSIGIAELNFSDGDLEKLLADVTAVLLEAKRDGRNQVTCHFGDLRIRSADHRERFGDLVEDEETR